MRVPSPIEPFSVFELEFPKLVAFDSNGYARNHLNFFDREKEEMRTLTEATEIGANVWVSFDSRSKPELVRGSSF